jgi:hypothetical protein
MGCRGVHFALTEEQANRLKSVEGDDELVLSIVQDDIEEAWDAAHLCESDKAWDAIHRCLTGGTLDPDAGSYPLNLCILGGKQLHSGDHYIVSFVSVDQVRDVARGLESITQEWFRNQYFSMDPQTYGSPEAPWGEEYFEYTWSNFEDIRTFYRRAAADGRAVIFSVDQ